MKKRIFMLAVLILSGLQFAVAAIDEQLRALITTSDDIEVTEVITTRRTRGPSQTEWRRVQ